MGDIVSRKQPNPAVTPPPRLHPPTEPRSHLDLLGSGTRPHAAIEWARACLPAVAIPVLAVLELAL